MLRGMRNGGADKVRCRHWQPEDARHGPGYPNGVVTAEPSTVHPPARPVRDDVAETATHGLLAKPQASLHLAANVHHRINLDPRYLSCITLATLAPSIDCPFLKSPTPNHLPDLPLITAVSPQNLEGHTTQPCERCWPRPHLPSSLVTQCPRTEPEKHESSFRLNYKILSSSSAESRPFP